MFKGNQRGRTIKLSLLHPDPAPNIFAISKTAVFSILNVVQIIIPAIYRCICLSVCVNASILRRFSILRTGSK